MLRNYVRVEERIPRPNSERYSKIYRLAVPVYLNFDHSTSQLCRVNIRLRRVDVTGQQRKILLAYLAVADPYFQIREGAGHPDPEIRGGFGLSGLYLV